MSGEKQDQTFVDNFLKALTDYNPSQYDKLPKFIKHRVNALKKLQLDRIKVDQQYHNELQELEIKFAKLYEPFNQKRFDIISGKYEPTEEECVLPACVLNYDEDGDQEAKSKDAEEDESFSQICNLDEAALMRLKPSIQGVPYFWLAVLKSSLHFTETIEEHDMAVLQYLSDIRVKYEKQDTNVTYILEFHFNSNPYFNKPVLTKKYYLRSEPDEKDPFSYEGHEVVKSEGCEIDWNEGKNVTFKVVNVRQKHKTKGTVRTKNKSVERESFFHFFSPPVIPEDRDEIDEETSTAASIDFELGETIRQSLIPKSVLYYTGYILDDDDEFGDEDEELDGSSSDDDDTSDESGSSNDDSLDGTEELSKKKLIKSDATKGGKGGSAPPECKNN